MSNDFVSEVTLECLMNKTQYEKYVNTKIDGSSASANKNHPTNKDIKFYRRRITDLTKHLLKNDGPQPLYSSVNLAFYNYVNSCIEHFKVLDKTDIIQTDYKGIVDSLHLDNSNQIYVENINSTEEANLLMMRSIKIYEPNSLEKLVKRTSTRVNTSAELKTPQQKDINLKDPILKNKGICKKKNITNKSVENKSIV